MLLKNNWVYFLKIFFSCLIFLALFSSAGNSSADTLEDLRKLAEEKTSQMKQIEEEIKKIQIALDQTTGEKETLKKEVARLESSKKKLNLDISLTQKKIDLANNNIEQLGDQIINKIEDIAMKRASLAETMRSIKEKDAVSVTELVLSKNNFSEFFNEVEMLENLQKKVDENLTEIKLAKDELEVKKTEEQKQSDKLKGLKSTFLDKKTLVDANKKEKDQLLSETKNKESNYKKIIAEKEKLQDEFENELNDIESKIKIEIDPSSIPTSGTGVLGWPFTDERMLLCRDYKKALGNVFCITQYYGVTSFAVANRNSKPHRALDFRAPVGTELVASENGVVEGTGDTDKTCKNASYGKWVLIKHTNGLSTMYAHMSLIKAYTGQTVKKGDLIGYSGNTGSSTGPHLHFMVMASQGVSVGTVRSKVCGKDYTIPIASINAYLNPLSYL